MPVDRRSRSSGTGEEDPSARLELLDLLAQGERSVENLAAAAQMKVSNTSAQLRMLAAAGLAASRR